MPAEAHTARRNEEMFSDRYRRHRRRASGEIDAKTDSAVFAGEVHTDVAEMCRERRRKRRSGGKWLVKNPSRHAPSRLRGAERPGGRKGRKIHTAKRTHQWNQIAATSGARTNGRGLGRTCEVGRHGAAVVNDNYTVVNALKNINN